MDSAAGPVGTVAELWRFPVKSMQGEPVEQARFGARAMVGDRGYAVREVVSGKLWSAKRHGSLLEARARTTDDGVLIELPGGDSLLATDADVDAALTRWLGSEVRLDRAADTGGSNGVYEFAFDIDDAPDAEWFDIDTPSGSFADLAHAHLLTTSSITAAAEGHAGGDWDVRRFRPSILVDTAGGAGFVEDDWVGRQLQVGGAVFIVDMPTIRCVMPTRPQPPLGGRPALARDKAVSRAVADRHGHNLGVYASVVTPGEVAVGDDVVLLPAG